MNLHPIYPGAWCVPSAIQCLTGADYASVIHPAINRHSHAYGLLDPVVGANVSHVAVSVLEEMGYTVRRYRKDDLSARIETWAQRSKQRYPGRALLVQVLRHCLVVKDGRVYDTHTPVGAPGARHPYVKSLVQCCALVERLV